MAEEHFIPSNSMIECSGCKGAFSTVVSTTANVFVKKQPMSIASDATTTHILPFCGICSYTLAICAPVLTGEWDRPRETIEVAGKMPLIEQSKIQCSSGGIITIMEKADTPPPPENIVDKAQSKINKAANYVTKKVTEVTQVASDFIGGIADTAKQAEGFLNNESVQGAINSAGDFVDQVDQKKAELDIAVGNMNIRLENLRKEITQLLTGEQQELKDLMRVHDKNS